MKKFLIVIALLGLAGFGWWTISPLFISNEVDDAVPAEKMTDGVLVRDESFAIVDTPAHPASGEVRILETADETLVRFENYDGTNGPDLFVYLAKDRQAKEFVSLGKAKGNKGNINYEVPDDVDISEYRYVMTWCRAFGVLFDYAEIN
jgi:hypothetical protein